MRFSTSFASFFFPFINNQRGDGGAGYRSSSGRGDFKLTGGSLVAARWLGIHQFNENDGAQAFPGHSGFSRGRLRQSYNQYVAHLANNWNNARSQGSHWADSMWHHGDMYCDNRNGVLLPKKSLASRRDVIESRDDILAY